MATYKAYSYEQSKLIPIHFDSQILPGTFEYTLSYLIDHEIDLSIVENRYNNDETGAPAYDPAILLKIVLFAYSRGIVSSRKIARCCKENVVFMALSADTGPISPQLRILFLLWVTRQRLCSAEPVFANIRNALGLARFTLRGKRKVDTQWKLYCIVHNLLKIHRFGPGFT